VAFDGLIEVVLGSAIHRGHQFMVHVDELIERIAVGLAEEAHQHV